jgi:hypothetical protein
MKNRTLDDLSASGANMLIGWVKGTMIQQDAQGRAVRRMVEDFLGYIEEDTPISRRAFRDDKPEAAQAEAA